jgi:hypothetical protein
MNEPPEVLPAQAEAGGERGLELTDGLQKAVELRHHGVPHVLTPTLGHERILKGLAL